MKVSILILLCFITLPGICQVDTLVIGKKKFPLVRVDPYLDHFQLGPSLPMEYSEYEKETTIKFQNYNDSVYSCTHDSKSGSDYFVFMMRKGNDSSKIQRSHILSNSLDTIIIEENTLHKLVPFIKSEGKEFTFFSATVLALNNNTLTEFAQEYRPKGDLFNFCSSGLGNRDTKLTYAKTFIIEDLYYRKGLETYYLDRQFIIIIK